MRTSGAERGRWAALAVLCAGALMVILDTTIVVVALPSIQGDLGLTQAGLAWVVDAYLIAFGGLLLLAGRLGDLVGRRRVSLFGLVLFTLASLLCGLADSQELLVAARFLQGVGGAAASAVILGMMVTMFPEPGERARAIAIYASVGAAGASIGLLAGGVLTELIGWHWIFFVNVPIGTATALLATRLLPAERGIGLAHGADAPGALLIVAALMLGVYTIVGAGERGWGAPATVWLGALALALLAAFVVREVRAGAPLVPPRIFRSRIVSAANLVQALMVAALFGMQFMVPLYLRRVLGFDPVEVGLGFVPIALTIGLLSLGVSARLIVTVGARATLVAGLAAIAVGLVLLSGVSVDGDYLTDLLPAMLVMGVGGGLALPAVTDLAMEGAGEADSGLASGLVNTTQQVGGALGVSVLVALGSARSDGLLADGASTAALTDGYRLVFAVGAGIVVAAMLLAAVLLRPERAPRSGAGRLRRRSPCAAGPLGRRRRRSRASRRR